MPIIARLLALALGLAAIAAHADSDWHEPSAVMDLRDLKRIEQIVPYLLEKRVVFVGETHDRYDHHLNQLEIIRRMHEADPRLVIGVEFFEQPVQESLDGFVDGDLSERDMLERTEYFSRWNVDYRLYRPILQFARDNGIPVVALNLPGEVTRKVGREGLEALTADERKWVPGEIDRSDTAYHERLRAVFREHPETGRSFDRFLDVQLLWDEGMAQRAAEYLETNPETRMVVLAGVGHVAHGSGIPQRIRRRVDVETAIVVHESGEPPSPGVADFLLFSRRQVLSAHGKLGILLGEADESGMGVSEVMSGSPAEKAGMRAGDRITALDGHLVHGLVDLRLALIDRKPGETMAVTVQREGVLRGARMLELEVTLY